MDIPILSRSMSDALQLAWHKTAREERVLVTKKGFTWHDGDGSSGVEHTYHTTGIHNSVPSVYCIYSIY